MDRVDVVSFDDDPIKLGARREVESSIKNIKINKNKQTIER